jgi:phage-related protein (TIGR01555 family)
MSEVAIPRSEMVVDDANARMLREGEIVNLSDTMANFLTGFGTDKDPTFSSRFVLHILNRNTLEKMYRGDWLSRGIVDCPAEDMTREWRAWQAGADEINAIEEVERAHMLQKKMKQALIRARLYGGAALVLGIADGKDTMEPLDVTRVKKDDLRFVVVMNRYELSAGPRIYNVDSPWYTRPEYYVVQTPTFGFQGEAGNTYPSATAVQKSNVTPLQRPQGGANIQAFWQTQGNRTPNAMAYSGMVRVHPSRVIEFAGNELPDWRLAPLGGGWGDSVLQTVEEAVKDFGVTVGGIAAMVNDAKLDVVKVADLARHFSKTDYANKLTARFAAANSMKSLLSVLLLDKDEEWERVTTSFGGLPDVLQRVLMIACAAGGVPMSRLTGQQQGRGLAAQGASGGEVDLRNYYDRCVSYMKTVITPNIQLLDECIIRSALGTYDADIHYNWNPLWQTSDAEKADIAQKKAIAVKTYVDTGLFNEDMFRLGVSNMIVEDGLLPGMEDAIEEFGLEPTIPESRVWSPGVDPNTGQNIMVETGGGGGDDGVEQTMGLPEAGKEVNDADLIDYWSDEAREAAAEAQKRAGQHDQAASDHLKAAASGGKTAIQHNVAAQLHRGTAASYRTESSLHAMGREHAGQANAMRSTATANARAAHDFEFRHKLVHAKALDAVTLVAKKSVKYGPGHAGESCGDCRHFIAGQHACEKVRGWIEADKWCELFAEKTTVGDEWSDEAREAAAEARKRQFSVAKAAHAQINAEVARHSETLRAFPRGEMGLTPDHVKSSPEYKTAKVNYEAANTKMRNFNANYTKVFAKELKEERANRFAKRDAIADAEPRTLYVYRKLRNGDAIARWAKQQGFKSTLDPSDMHVTIAHSKKAVDWSKAGDSGGGYASPGFKSSDDDDDAGFLTVPSGGARQLQAFGKDGKCAVVLLFNSSALGYRHNDIKDRTGATWDYPDYQPHVMITWNAPANLSTNETLRKIEPYRGPIELGPEQFDEIDENWMKHHAEDAMTNIGDMTFDGFGSSQLAYEYYKPGGPGWVKDHDRTRTVRLIRHGATDLNADDVSVDRIRGWTDVPLSPEGREEAVRLGADIADNPPAAIYTSDLKRALHTADEIASHCGTAVAACRQDFRPWNVGIYAGQTTEDAMPDLKRFACETPDDAVLGGESFNDFRRRFFKGILRALTETATGDVAIVAHHRNERLLDAWRALGYPSDGSMDAETFCQRGEPTGSVLDFNIPMDRLREAAAHQ